MKINLTNITNTSFSTIKKTRYANTQVATKVSFKSTKSIHEGFTKKEIVAEENIDTSEETVEKD